MICRDPHGLPFGAQLLEEESKFQVTTTWIVT